MRRTRDLGRKSRERVPFPVAAIVGYTNAGKSTLMNVLTSAGVVVADQLFATLDPTTRRLALPGGRKATISDTVGFVGKLPHDLVEAFRSTLEEVTLTSLVLHVADAASPSLDDQIDAVRQVLGEIGAGDLPEVLVLNKLDLLEEPSRSVVAHRHPDAVPISALTGRGIPDLLQALAHALPAPPVDVTLLIPFGREDVIAQLYRNAQVLEVAQTPREAWSAPAWASASSLPWGSSWSARRAAASRLGSSPSSRAAHPAPVQSAREPKAGNAGHYRR